MSRVMRSPADTMTRPPTRNTGPITVTPHRMPQAPATAEITGMAAMPASTNSDPMANPVDRARGGMASERAAKRPGSTNARQALMTMWANTATYTFGAQANTSTAPVTTKIDLDSRP